MFCRKLYAELYNSAVAQICAAFIALFFFSITDAHSQQFQNQSEADTAYEDSRSMIAKGDYQGAITKLKQFITDPAKYPKPVSDYIVLLLWTGSTDDAIKTYENLPDGFPKTAFLLRNVAKGYYDKRRPQNAVSLYKAALADTPNDTEALKGLALSHIELGDYESGSEQLKNLITKLQNDSDIRILYSTTLFKAGRHYEAIRSFRAAAELSPANAENIYRTRDALVQRLADNERMELLKKLAPSDSNNPSADYIVMLAATGQYSKAISEFHMSEIRKNNAPLDVLNWVAWSYFKIDAKDRAKQIFSQVLSSHPENMQATIGISYCLSSENNSNKALEVLSPLQSKYPYDIDVLYAKAYAFERSGEFIKAVNEYDRILSIDTQNITAKRLRLYALSDIGATTPALQETIKTFPDDKLLIESITGNAAVDRLRWAENEKAISLLNELRKNPGNRRAQLDYLAALFESRETSEAIELYKYLERQNIDLPVWIIEYAAGGYLDQEQPDRAMYHYSKALKLEPSSYKARLGMFQTLSIMRRWDEAEAHLSSLEKEISAPIVNEKPNFGKLSLAYERGWFLISQDRLSEAEEHFMDLYSKAPGNTEARNGLAHVFYYRGWPRKAYEEFSIISNLEPEELGYKTGLIISKNGLDQKTEARSEAQEMLSKNPKSRILKNLVRDLKVQDLDELTASLSVTSEEGGFGDTQYYLSYSHAFTPYTRAYAFLYHERSRDSNQTNNFKRAGLGIYHIFSRYLSATQQLSLNYDDSKDIGSFTSLSFTPDDHWTFSASFDSYTSDVPFRARVTGISSKKYDFGISYRVSELSDYSLSLTRYDFSDSNKRDMLNLGHSRQIFQQNDWKMRLFFNFYTSRNSLDNAEYFNPDSDWKFSLTHMTEHTLRKIYRQSWIHRLYITSGLYKQNGYSGKLDKAIRYEHDISFSDTQSLVVGASYGQNHYDASPTNSYTFYINYRGRL
ncbi:MAG: tetratricopeptide repeat protein [Nitrospirae bacterium]|nr:tetratricopeptide repeat protein [Nitrospirota bacterium]